MKGKVILFSILAIILNSCANIYYVGETSTPLSLYNTPDSSSSSICFIPVNTKVLSKSNSFEYCYVIYQGYKGYVYNPKFSNYHKFNSVIDGSLYGYTSGKTISEPSSVHSGSVGGSVNVKGYYRKNGTYVQPHTRSSPRRR